MTESMVLTPITVGNIELPNRVVVSSHSASESFRNPLLASDGYIEYMRRRAAGGAGTLIEQFYNPAPGAVFAEQFKDATARLVEVLHYEGAKVLVQLSNLGAMFRTELDVRRPALQAFDDVSSPEGEPAHRMTDDEIEETIAAYRLACRVAAQTGHDGVEIHGAHGYLVQQSLSPGLNSRVDKWGMDRSLFARRILLAAREEVGPERIVGYRTPTDDFVSPEDGGVGREGFVELIRSFVSDGLIDYVNTTVGTGFSSYSKAVGSYRHPAGELMPLVKSLRAALDGAIPVVGVGRILTLGQAEALLQNGECDLVGMVRAHIADPDHVAKLRRGESHRIRPCVGANVCVDRKLAGAQEITCFHNPEVLREKELAVVPVVSPLQVLVVGAGPAGLKAAEAAALRGHSVKIRDAAAEPGGLLRAARHTPAIDLVATVEHLASELKELDVDIKLKSLVSGTDLDKLRPDVIVLATGGRLERSVVYGQHDGTVVLTPAAALEGPCPDDVLVYDDLGSPQAALVAEGLCRQGKRVTFASAFETVIPFAGYTHRPDAVPILHRLVGASYTSALIGSAVDGKVTLVDREGETIAEVLSEAIVAVSALTPVLDLVPDITSRGIPYHVAGNARAHRDAFQAFKEGREIGILI